MVASNYRGTKTEHEEQAYLRAIDERHIAAVPEDEREEIRQICRGKRFAGTTRAGGRRRHRGPGAWSTPCSRRAYGLPEAVRSPLEAVACTFACLVLCGAVPLLPILVEVPAASQLSIGMTALAFFLIGSTKSPWSPAGWWRSGSETLAIGLAPQRSLSPPVTLSRAWSEPAAAYP
jgi:hypothetical protein